jgi:hypothetical protein
MILHSVIPKVIPTKYESRVRVGIKPGRCLLIFHYSAI